MNTAIASSFQVESEKLARKRAELSEIQAELIDRELQLADLQASVSAFEGHYLRSVGVLYAELDDWAAKIAEASLGANPSERAKSAAAESRAQADATYAAAHGETAMPRLPSSPELKAFYRKLAKAVHPDLASSEQERIRREQVMAQVNKAYERGDMEALRRLLEDWEASPEAVQGSGVLADLARVSRQILQIRNRLTEIGLKLEEVWSSEIAQLMAKIDTARSQGRDLLVEMEQDVARQVTAAKTEYAEIIANEREL